MDFEHINFKMATIGGFFYVSSPGLYWVTCTVNLFSNGIVPFWTAIKLSQQPFLSSLKKIPVIDRGGLKQKVWKQDENETLFELVNSSQVSWQRAAYELNTRYHSGEKIRTGKHCRERWNNYLDPTLISNEYVESEWALDEDINLFQLQQTHGKKWSFIASKMNGRNENSVKNRFNNLVKKSRLIYNLQETPEEYVIYLLIQMFEAQKKEQATNFTEC